MSLTIDCVGYPHIRINVFLKGPRGRRGNALRCIDIDGTRAKRFIDLRSVLKTMRRRHHPRASLAATAFFMKGRAMTTYSPGDAQPTTGSQVVMLCKPGDLSWERR